VDNPNPQTGVAVETKFIPLAFLLYFFHPVLHIDGGPVIPAKWGVTFLPTDPGRHVLRAYVPYLFFRTMGDSSLEVEVAPGQTVTARWRAPWLTFLKGKWSLPAAA
jgi:hypothetical protein